MQLAREHFASRVGRIRRLPPHPCYQHPSSEFSANKVRSGGRVLDVRHME